METKSKAGKKHKDQKKNIIPPTTQWLQTTKNNYESGEEFLTCEVSLEWLASSLVDE